MRGQKPTLAQVAGILDEREDLRAAHARDGALDPGRLAAYRERKADLLGRVADHLTPPVPGELEVLEEDRRLLVLEIRELLAGEGVEHLVEVEVDGLQFAGQLDRVRLWDQSPLPSHLRGRIERAHTRLELVQAQIRALTEPTPGSDG